MKKPTFNKTGQFIHYCECGEWGSFGENVNLRLAIKNKDVTLAGRWYCSACWRKKNGHT